MRRLLRSRAGLTGVAAAAGTVAGVVAVVVIARSVDGGALADAWRSARSDHVGVLACAAALLAAFTARAVAWKRILPAISVGQSLAAIHLAMGANHVLPVRLGEPLRVVSVVRRSGVSVPAATASALTLRAADVLTLVGIGVVLAPGAFVGLLGAWGWAVVAAVVAVAAAGLMWLRRLAASDGAGVALPSAIVVVLTASAWLLEAVVVWRASGWAGIDLAYHDALLVTAAAVSAQIVAVAPSGVGTYEAAAVAAFGIAGHDPAVALAAAVAAHAVKTAYSLVAGGVALAVPAPSLVGRLRLPRTTERQVAPPGDGPIVLFLPAHDEEHTVADVAARAPRNVGGRDVRVVVVDDGSTDETATRALEAGAEVVGFPENRGLGAAVRRGIEHSLAAHDPSVVVFCDADGEYAPEELGRMVEPILSGRAHYVVGSRFTGRIDRMLAHRRFGNRVLTAGLRWVARRPITDGQSGYRALHRDAAAEAWIAHDYNYAQVLTLDLVGRGFVYHEVPISYGFRTQGRSFVRLGRYLRCVIPAVHAVVNRPLGGGDIPVIDLIRTEHTMEETVR